MGCIMLNSTSVRYETFAVVSEPIFADVGDYISLAKSCILVLKAL